MARKGNVNLIHAAIPLSGWELEFAQFREQRVAWLDTHTKLPKEVVAVIVGYLPQASADLLLRAFASYFVPAMHFACDPTFKGMKFPFRTAITLAPGTQRRDCLLYVLDTLWRGEADIDELDPEFRALAKQLMNSVSVSVSVVLRPRYSY
jgi:hypothetical protein